MNLVAKNHSKSLGHSTLLVLSKYDLSLKMEVNLKYEYMATHYYICSITECYLSDLLQAPVILY